MRVYPVFHKKLLERAPLDAELATDIELEDDEYEVEEIRTCGKSVVSGNTWSSGKDGQKARTLGNQKKI